ncbi:4'-phosphopantetheinyl transferase family protein [Streptomyces sp. NBC_00344]|uniref:4'-phosphopantetheinyl transferase family protein n=1 Tax=Streptomyces sp. NBC_00344 TaxID=2975720 RepID=UPI002E205C60
MIESSARIPAGLVLEEAAPVSTPLPEDRTPVVWLVDVAGQGNTAARLAPGILDGSERSRLASFHREEDRARYATAHVALRLLLGAQLGLAPSRVRLARESCPCCGGPHGRPVTSDGPVHFSLSHSGGLVLIGFSSAPVGVDVEETPDIAVAREVSRELHPLEARELAALPEGDRPTAFARVWARKEACLKGLGTGLGRSPSLDYVGTDPASPSSPDGWRVEDVAVPDGYAAATAVRTAP